MSKRREIEEHMRTLQEIQGIMGAMKNLSLMESHKLGRVLAMQHRVVEALEAAGGDFLAFYPGLPPDAPERVVYVVIGAERGFCGDFNDRLLSAFDRYLHETDEHDPHVILIGQKLVEHADRRYRVAASEAGATVAEEIQHVLTRVVDRIREAGVGGTFKAGATVTAIYHDAVTESVAVRALRPVSSLKSKTSARAFPPLLTLSPADFFAQLVDLYLFSVLHAIFYSALMAENRARVAHLESALQRLERDQADLLRKRNVLRQEEITEEIEVLMLSSSTMPRHW